MTDVTVTLSPVSIGAGIGTFAYEAVPIPRAGTITTALNSLSIGYGAIVHIAHLNAATALHPLTVRSIPDSVLLLKHSAIVAHLAPLSYKISSVSKTLGHLSTHSAFHPLTISFGQLIDATSLPIIMAFNNATVDIIDDSYGIPALPILVMALGQIGLTITASDVHMPAVPAIHSKLGKLTPITTVPIDSNIQGLVLHSDLGQLKIVGQQTGLSLTTFLCAAEVQSVDNVLSMSWSDDRGVTFLSPLTQSLGGTGEYAKSLQFRRLGLGRTRVFKLEFTCDCFTALKAIFIETQESGS